jgi:hypothetical protein
MLVIVGTSRVPLIVVSSASTVIGTAYTNSNTTAISIGMEIDITFDYLV